MKAKRVKEYLIDYVAVYNNMSVTFREFFEALEQLGFKNHSTDTRLRYTKGTPISTFDVPMRPLDKEMLKTDIRAFSWMLYMQGEIQDPDDFAKMIEANRTKATEKLVQTAV